MKKATLLLLAVVLLFVLTSCTVAKVTSEYNSKTNTVETKVEYFPSIEDDISNIFGH